MKYSPKTHSIKSLVAATIAITCAQALAGDQDWNYTYNSSGQVLFADGPRTDLSDTTSYTYDGSGNKTSSTNALGHTTLMQNYNKRGQVGLITDANGVETELTYHARGWLRSSTVIDTGGSATSTYTYDLEGQLLSTTLPNGNVLFNEYDAAHRLIAISNNAGERIEYVLDAAGNRLSETTSSPGQSVTRSLNMAYDELNRLISLTGAAGQTSSYTYDRNGNRTSTTDGNLNTSVREHDPLNRLARALAPLNHNSSYVNDAQDNLIEVTDPKGLLTSYRYDGLNNLIQLTSPDTGVTLYTYDNAGNMLSQRDANGVTASYSYGALNRLHSISYPNSDLNITYRYDEGTYGKGQLTSITDASGTTVIDYDHRGNIIYQGLDVGGKSFGSNYAYNTTQQLIRVSYPSGRVVDYSRGANGLITAASTTTSEGTQQLASNATYLPFGPLSALDYGNGIRLSGSYDLDYRLTQLEYSTLRETHYGYDNADNILSINDSLNNITAQSFGYDALNRLGTALGSYGGLSYSYDENGNRLSYTDSSGADNYTYDANSHRLLSSNDWIYEYDNNGNRIAKLSSDGSGDGLLYLYEDNNRMVEVVERKTVTTGKGGGQTTVQVDTSLARYIYNGNGQRARKITPDRVMHYLYGQDDLLLAEVDDSGATHREYIYLNGQPIAAAHYTYTEFPETSGPEILMDDGDSGSGNTGSWVNTRKKGAYNDYYSLSNNSGNTYRFTPSGLKDANYEIYAWWPKTNKNNETTQFTIAHNGQTSTTTQDQSASGKQWIKLGKFRFSGSGSEYIELSDLGGKTAADGIRLVELIPGDPPIVTTNLYYIHNDHLGTPQVFTDVSQAIVWNANYKPFGEVAVSIGSIANNLRFPGQYFDEESGLHYNYFRDYDPGLGRYLQNDPIGLASGLNTYSYVNGNPLRGVDPSGLWTLSVEGYFIAGGGVSVTYSNGTLEVLSRLGVGFGAEASYDPFGVPTPHSESCGSGYIATTSLQFDASVGAKPFAIGGSYTASTGNAVTTTQGGGFQSYSPTNISPVASPKVGIGISFSIGPNFGSYTNW